MFKYLPPNRRQLFVTVELSCFSLFACKREQALLPTPITSRYFVSEAQARTAAENIYANLEVLTQRRHNQQTGDTQRVFRGRQRILNITAVPAADGQPGLYFCNYAQGGFSIIAADRHMQPILVFAEHGTLPTHNLHDTHVIPEGLITWLENTNRIVSALRANPSAENTAPGAAESWTTAMTPLCPDLGDGEPPTCEEPVATSTQVGPLVQSSWGQGRGYNDLTPSSNNAVNNYHSPTGCVATAVAQVMRYWQWPTRFNWANMPLDKPSADVALLMSNCGFAIRTSYGDEESGAYPNNAAGAYRDIYQYSADYHSYEAGTYMEVINNLDAQRPVIIGGFRNNFAGVVPYNGHSWVCDGYIQSYYNGTGYLRLHMNWGYDGYYNAWVNFDSWQIHFYDGTVREYKYGRDIIADIHP